jgi:hypothetical protein
VASVAADPSAIAPPLPLPSRPDATPPAGASGAFADLLNAPTPATARQSQVTFAARTDAATNAAQSGTTANGTGNTDPATAGAATAGPRHGSKDANGQATPVDNGTAAGNASADVTVVAGLAMAALAIAPLPNPDQTPASPQDAQGASADPAPPTGRDAASPSDDRKNASASSDALPAGVVAALSIMMPIAAATSAPEPSTPGRSGPIPSLPPTGPVPAVFSAASMSAPAAGPDAGASSVPSPQPDGTAQPSPKAPAVAQDMLAAAPSAVSATFPAPELQTAALPVLPRAAASSAAPDQTARPAPAVAPVTAPMAPSGPVTPVTAPAPLSPPASLTPVSAAIHVADPPAGNAGPSRDVDSIPIALPMQVAVRFASPGHADDRGAADSGTDVMSGFASAGVGGASGAASNEPAGAAIPAGFNPVPPNPTQAASAPLTAPPHAAVMTDAVPLAGIPIAIVARAEGGEKKFEIRLDPPDLGRIEVQLNVDSSGRATSHLVVDRADTLDLLRRDAPALERALQSAGLTTDDGALQFSLRDQSFAGRDQGAPAPVAPPAPVAVAESDVAPIDTALRRYGLPAGLGSGVDIRV